MRLHNHFVCFFHPISFRMLECIRTARKPAKITRVQKDICTCRVYLHVFAANNEMLTNKTENARQLSGPGHGLWLTYDPVFIVIDVIYLWSHHRYIWLANIISDAKYYKHGYDALAVTDRNSKIRTTNLLIQFFLICELNQGVPNDFATNIYVNVEHHGVSYKISIQNKPINRSRLWIIMLALFRSTQQLIRRSISLFVYRYLIIMVR